VDWCRFLVCFNPQIDLADVTDQDFDPKPALQGQRRSLGAGHENLAERQMVH
jgi:hypothetical protein